MSSLCVLGCAVMSPVKIPAVLLSFVALTACHQLFGLQEVKEEDLCGDGELLAVEECDDGANIAGDGCGTACQIEPGFECGSGRGAGRAGNQQRQAERPQALRECRLHR